MASPTRHPRTGIFQHIVRVPKDVATLALGRKVSVPVGSGRREIVLGAVAKVSLATRDPAEAKVRFVAVADALNLFYGGLREGPVTLSHKRRQVIAGAIYHEALAEYEEEPGSAAKWREMASILEKHAVGDHDGVDDMREMFFGDRVTDALAERGLVITTESRRDLLKDVVEPFSWFLRDIAAAADKDYTRRRFPTDTGENAPPKRTRRAKGKGITFDSIIDERAKRLSAGRDAKGANDRTIAKFRREARIFAAFRESDDATTVTRAEIESWIVALQNAKKIGNRTIGLYVVDVGTVWGWGRKMFSTDFPDASPFKGVELPTFETIPPSERAFRLDEARAILHAARKSNDPAIRWLPFLAAYSGARISEISYLTREEFRKIEGKWYFRIDNNQFRKVKTKHSKRTVPVHPMLLQEGIMEFVEKTTTGMIWKANDHEEVGRWIAKTVQLDRQGLQPSHGWRHFMTDLLTVAGASNRVRHGIMGRTTGSSEEAYGGGEMALIGLWNELAKVPAIIPPPNATKPETDKEAL